jgi:hypothetical protein
MERGRFRRPYPKLFVFLKLLKALMPDQVYINRLPALPAWCLSSYNGIYRYRGGSLCLQRL